MQETSPETVGFRLSPQQAQPLVLERGNAVQVALALTGRTGPGDPAVAAGGAGGPP